MKKLTLFVLISFFCFSCENQKNAFPDFDYTSAYFPYQYPVRTLILGTDYTQDNSADNAHTFRVSAAMGGVYENREERIVKFAVDEALCNNAFFEDGSPIHPLPEAYYQLSDPEKIVIEPGKFNGGVVVHLNDAFFDDPLAFRNSYVLPLRITGIINLDSLLQGEASDNRADPRISGEWLVAPKHFTLFCVKFINPYHGHFLRRGAATLSVGGTETEKVLYRDPYVERDEVLMLTTSGKTQVQINTFLQTEALKGALNMTLNFASNPYNTPGGVACTIVEAEDEPYTVTGTGKYIVNADEFGAKPRDALYLSYTVMIGTQQYEAQDTLVLRDRNVMMELFTPVIKN